MPPPHEKLRDAYQEHQRVAVTEIDGTVHEGGAVWDFTRVRTNYFEVWRFVLRNEDGKTRLFGSDLQSVDVLDEGTSETKD